MDSPLKQRLIGAAVLAALAVIFLPMLVKGPDARQAADATDVPLDVPDEPRDADGMVETRDLPLVRAEHRRAGRRRVATGMPTTVDRARSMQAGPQVMAPFTASDRRAGLTTPVSFGHVTRPLRRMPTR